MHRDRHQTHPRAGLALALLALAFLASACSTTRQTRDLETRGFLSDYSMLREGKGDEAQLIYINPDAGFSHYRSVLLDSVTLWYSSDEKMSREDRQMLTDHLYAALHEQLGEQGFAIAEAPGPGVLRLRAAITEARGSSQVANAVTSIVPQARVLSTVGGLATDTAIFVGKAGLEAEVTDSLSGRLLAAGVDERVGTKTLRGAFGKWTHVKQSFDHWAKRLAERLAQERGA